MKLPIRAVLCLLGVGAPASVPAQTAENVAVIINESAPESQRVGEHYVQRRHIPAANVIRIRVTPDDTIDRAEYVRAIEAPIAAALARARLQDRVLYLVLTKGVPLRIAGTSGQDGTGASVDSELTLLYRRMAGQTVFTRGRVDNPYYLGTRDIREAAAFTHRDYDIFLVSRLDAFTVSDALALVDRAQEPSTEGRIVLDQLTGTGNRLGDAWLAEAARRLSADGRGDRVLLETTTQPVGDLAPAVGYYSWGTPGADARGRRPGITFVSGAIAASFASADARTFREPPATWVPTNARAGRAAWFEGSPQPLIGDLIRGGATGVAGHVAEPYLQSVVRPEVLFPAYLAGHNIVEAFYLALPHLSWQAVIVGDPLCAPFPRKTAAASALAPSIDPETDLPAYLSNRLVEALSSRVPGMPRDAVIAWVRASGLLARDERAKAQAELERVVELAPASVAPRLALAFFYEQERDFEAAIAQYQQIVTLDPRHAVALNNLAYALGVHRGKPKEALPFAERATRLAPADGSVLDTLGWLEHLNGNDAGAVKRLAEAIQRSPRSADIRLHAAIAYAGIGARGRAEAELKEALRLNPALAETKQVEELRARLVALSQ